MKINLPHPTIDEKLSFYKAIQNRRSTRRFRESSLSLEEISNILFVGAGELRPKTQRLKSKRTVPSARNSQCVSIYPVTRDGVFKYLESSHSIERIKKGNYISKLTSQTMMHSAPFGLLYIVDFSKLTMYTATNKERMNSVASVEVGCMAQNIALYCSAKQLGSVIVGLVDREFFGELLHLENKEVLYSQVIGQKK